MPHFHFPKSANALVGIQDSPMSPDAHMNWTVPIDVLPSSNSMRNLKERTTTCLTGCSLRLLQNKTHVARLQAFQINRNQKNVDPAKRKAKILARPHSDDHDDHNSKLTAAWGIMTKSEIQNNRKIEFANTSSLMSWFIMLHVILQNGKMTKSTISCLLFFVCSARAHAWHGAATIQRFHGKKLFFLQKYIIEQFTFDDPSLFPLGKSNRIEESKQRWHAAFAVLLWPKICRWRFRCQRNWSQQHQQQWTDTANSSSSSNNNNCNNNNKTHASLLSSGASRHACSEFAEIALILQEQTMNFAFI